MRLALLGLVFVLPAAWAAPMYKCVDAKGVTHYTEQPVAGCKGKEVDIRPVPPPSGQETKQSDAGQREREFRQRQIERGQADERRAAEAKQREQRCKAAKSDLARMSNTRLYTTNARGEREFLDDNAAAAKVARQQDEVKRACE